MHIKASDKTDGWKRDYFSCKHRSKGSAELKKLEVPIPWTKDNCTYTLQKKIATFFEEHTDISFNGDEAAAREEHACWNNRVQERKREAKEKLKQRTTQMDKKQKEKFRASLLQELKETYVLTVKRDLMEPADFAKCYSE